MTTRVVDGEAGVFAVSLPAFITTKLEEGKYVYDCVVESPNGERSNAVSGLCFVDVSFGSRSGESLFDGGGASADGGITLDGGGA